MIKNIPCILFAGGKSSRMGEDKALLPFDDFETLTQFQLTRLSALFSEVYISCKSADKFDFVARFIEDDPRYSVSAPTLGFYSALVQTDADVIFVLSVDTPFVSAKEIKALILEFDTGKYDAVIARTKEESHPLCGVYSSRLLETFKNMLKEDNHRLGAMLKKVNTKYLDFEEESAFLNLNHPHEYQEALKRANSL